MYSFDVEKATKKCIEWIKNWFSENGKGCKAVIGVSGGKDSSVTAALLVKALGKENVIGVLMPKGKQFDIDYAIELCKILDIENYTVNIKAAYDALMAEAEKVIEISNQSVINLSPRLRMATLYLISQSKNGRVINTCNYSEDYVGYSTRYGDTAGDMSPISCFTVSEVKKIGRYLGLPEKFIEKPPIDGLCGKTDEENLGFTYDTLDKYIREGVQPERHIKEKIDRLHKQNLFKLKYMDSFVYEE